MSRPPGRPSPLPTTATLAPPTVQSTQSSMAAPATPARPASAIAETPAGRRVTIEAVAADLLADSIIDAEQAGLLTRGGRFSRSELHPLAIVADQKWKDPRPGRKLLGLDNLTEWFAEKAGLPYLKIDPFKIDFAGVTQVVSNAYATRFRILPVAVTPREVTLAVCEPFIRRQIKLVNPDHLVCLGAASAAALLGVKEEEVLTYFNLQRYLNHHYLKAAPVATA